MLSRGLHPNVLLVLEASMAGQLVMQDLSLGNAVDYFIMPRNKEQASKQNEDGNLKDKSKQQDGPPGYIDISVVGTGSKGSPRSVVLNFAPTRFLFNCGEGTQRIMTERKMKMSKIEHQFITRNIWGNVGGLMGMSLSLKGIDVETCHLHGPPKVEYAVSKSFFMKDLERFNLEKHEVTEKEFGNDVHVQYLPIYPLSEETDSGSPVTKRRKVSVDDRDMCVAYVIKPKPKLRAISLEKCVNHGVTRGPMIGLLKNNKSVTLADGKVVHPEDVLGPQEPSGPIIVLECPSESYIDSVVNDKRLKELQTAVEGNEPVVIVIHMTPQVVFEHPKYQEWINEFMKETRHLILNENCSPTSLEHTYVLQKMFNRLHAETFPLLWYSVSEREDAPEDVTDEKFMYGKTGLIFVYRPTGAKKRGFSTESVVKQNELKYEIAANNEPMFLEAKKKLEEQLQSEEYKKSSLYKYFKDKEFPEIVFLGTGSSMPSKGRNVSAILVHTSPDSCFLLDVGESTSGQIHRFYGPNAEEVFRKLKAIYLSHLHADHHMGFTGVVQERRKAFEAVGQEASPLEILCPKRFQTFIQNMAENLSSVSYDNLHFTTLEDLHVNEIQQELTRITDILQLSKLSVCKVRHPQYAFGVRLDHNDGWSLSYSGDTMPCDNFVQLSKDVDIMIHEATMEDDLIKDAEQKNHSTLSQAMSIGQQANAKFILLTHFSQRYAKVPRMTSEHPDNIGIAFDNMRVKAKNLALLPLFIEPLKYMFPKAVEEMAVKTMRKKKIQELETHTRIVTHIDHPSKQLEVTDGTERSLGVTDKCQNNKEQVTTKEDNSESTLAEEKYDINNTSDFASEKKPIRQ